MCDSISSDCSDTELDTMVSQSLKAAYTECQQDPTSIPNNTVDSCNVDSDADTSDTHNNKAMDNGPGPSLTNLQGSESENNVLFVIDRSSTCGQSDQSRSSSGTGSMPKKKRKPPVRLATGINKDDLYINIDPSTNPHRKLKHREQLTMTVAQEKVMDKCVMKPGFEQLHSVPPYEESQRIWKKHRKIEREKTKGDKWNNMRALDMTDEQKNDLKILQMRKAVNPKHFYKANDLTALPKYCQFGKIVETAADFYSSRVPRKQRHQTIADELLHDTQFTNYTKSKHAEIKEAKRLGTGPYQMRREREKKRDKKRRLRKAMKML